jgi:hypothetical protein
MFALMFGFVFSLASCNDDKNKKDDTNQTDDDNNKKDDDKKDDDKKDDNPVDPGNQGDPADPVDPVDPGNQGDPADPVDPVDPADPVEPAGPTEDILSVLPQGHFAKLLANKNYVTVNFKDFRVNVRGSEYAVDNASYIKVAYEENTLKANGILKLTANHKALVADGAIYFSFDGEEFIARLVSTGELTFANPEYEGEAIQEVRYRNLDGKQEVYYYDIKAYKDQIFEMINEAMQEIDPEFDINEIDSIDDVKALIGIEEENVPTASTLINEKVEVILKLLFNPEFADNQITVSLDISKLKIANKTASYLSVENVVDMLLGAGTYEKFVSITSEYIEADTKEAPVEGITYYTYDDETKAYTAVEITEFAADTKYYIDNKQLGEYSVDDLIKYNTEDEGLVTIEQIDEAITNLFSLVNKIFGMLPEEYTEETPSILNLFKNEDNEFIFDQGSLVQPIMMLLALVVDSDRFMPVMSDPYLILKPVTGLTEWRKNAEYYLVEDVFHEAEGIEAFVEGTRYFIKTENDEFVLVDTDTEAFDSRNTYYVFYPGDEVVTTRVRRPDPNVTYYVEESHLEYSVNAIEFTTEFDKDTTYYKAQYNEVNIQEFEEGVDYYFLNTEYFDLEPVDTEETPAPIEGVRYFVELYVEVDQEETPRPVSGIKYYVKATIDNYVEQIINNQEDFEEGVTYYIYEPVEEDYIENDLEEFDPYEKYYVKETEEYYEELNTEFDSNTHYFTYNQETEEYTEVKSPENGGAYYVGYEYSEQVAYDNLEEFDEEKEYYTATTEYEYVVCDDLEEFEAEQVYYVKNESNQFVQVEEEADFNPNETYYVRDEMTKYSPVDIYEPSEPDSEATYYTMLDKISDILSLDAIKTIDVNYLATQIYRIVSKYQMRNETSSSEEYKNAMERINNTEINVDAIINPILVQFGEQKVYDLIAEALDQYMPIYEVAEVTAWAEDTEYYTYSDELKSYFEVDTEEVTTPVAGTTYYVLKERTAADVVALIDERIEFLADSISLDIVSDNQSKLQKVELGLDFEVVSGTITLDFVTAYSDEVNADLQNYKVYVEEEDYESTRIFEEVATEAAFEGYKEDTMVYSVIKDEETGKVIGIRWDDGDEYALYYFGENKSEYDEFESAKEYFDENILRYDVCLKNEDGDFEQMHFYYDLTSKKFLDDEDYNYTLTYYYDYETEDYVLLEGYNFNDYAILDGLLLLDIERVNTEEVTTPVAGTRYFYFDEEWELCSDSSLEAFDEETTYFTATVIAAEEDRPLVIKNVNKKTGKANYHEVYYVFNVMQ